MPELPFKRVNSCNVTRKSCLQIMCILSLYLDIISYIYIWNLTTCISYLYIDLLESFT